MAFNQGCQLIYSATKRLVSTFFNDLFVFYVCVSCWHISSYTVYIQFPCRLEEGNGSLELGIKVLNHTAGSCLVVLGNLSGSSALNF